MNRTERVAASNAEMQANVEQLVRFERYYARRLRATGEARRPNEGDVSLAQAEILHELRTAPCPIGWLRERLGLDAGYLSRSLRWLALTGDLAISVTPGDGRGRLVSLTDGGKRTARILGEERAERARKTLEELPLRQRRRLVRAMAVIVEVLERDALTNFLESHRDRNGQEFLPSRR
jgi:DNA-binding MarR family transcriptional regulator